MATTYQDTNVNQLVINKLNKQEYDNLSQVSETELYLVEESLDSTVTQGSTNPVQSGAVYEALQDIGGNINDGTTTFIKNNKTVGVTSANQALDKTIKIPNDIIMCKMSDGIVYDSYITYTKIKQYLPDYPYYSDDLNWEIGGNPPMRANIVADGYYLDVDTNHIFVADENIELVDVTSSVVIQGDTNKLYCDTNTNQLYRYDGTNFIALTSEGKTYTLSSKDENIRLTDSDGQTQDLSLNTLINGLSLANSDPQDNDYIISQYVNGGTNVTTYHRRPLSKFWNWIKSKLGIGTNDGTFLRKDGTWVTPTDTKATVTTTGSGNAITSLTASNGALTATKGSTFLTSVPKFLDNSDFSINVPDYKCLLISDITDFINSTSVNIPLQGFEGIVISVRTSGYISDTNNSAFITAMVSYDKTHKVMKTSSSSLYPQVVKYNNKYYIAIRKGTQATTLYFFGYSRNLLSPLLTVNYNDCEIINDYTTTNTIANGGTGATTAANARANLGIGNVGTLTYASDTTKYLRNDGTWQAPTNTWRPLGTGASDACAGNDSRLSNSRPASDVYAWAKASTKPSYTASEVGALSEKNLSYNNTYGASPSGYVYAYKYGRMCTLIIECYGTASVSISSVYYPIRTVYGIAIASDSSSTTVADGNCYIMTVSSNGIVKCNRAPSKTIYCTITYITAN